MKEAYYIRATHIARMRIIADILHYILAEGEGLSLDITGITEGEHKDMTRIATTVIERLERLVEKT